MVGNAALLRSPMNPALVDSILDLCKAHTLPALIGAPGLAARFSKMPVALGKIRHRDKIVGLRVSFFLVRHPDLRYLVDDT